MELTPARRASHALPGYGLSVLAVAAATWIELLISESSARGLALTPFGLSVAASVWLGGLGPGLVAVLLASLSIDYFIIGPGSLLEFRTTGDTFTLGAFVAAWLAFCAIAERRHRGHASDRRRCRSAEDTALQANRVAQLTTALSRARTQSAAIEAALQEPLHALGADAGALLLVGRDGRSLEVARTVGYPAAGRQAPRPDALRGKHPALDAVGRGAPVILETASAYAAEYRAASSPGALVAVPLLVGSRVVAVVQLEFRAPRVFSKDDREYLEVLGPRAAQALDRTLVDRKTNGGDIAKVGAGTAIGAVAGRVIGGNTKGAIIGGIIGGAIGTQRAIETQDRDVVVPANSRVELTLQGEFTR
jgi:K+-sensing histidine kinase KdpD